MNYQNHRNLTLNDLVNVLKTESARKRDMIVLASHLSMKHRKLILDTGTDSKLNAMLSELGMVNAENQCIEDITQFDILTTCHEHFSEKFKIPKAYYDRLLNEPSDILDRNVNEWLQHEDYVGDNYLLRAIQTEDKIYARALLSDRYKCIDHFDILMSVLDTIRKSGLNVKLDKGDITDKRMYVRFICPEIEIDASNLLKNYRVPGFKSLTYDKTNTGIISGFVITNSETGHGTFSISPRAVVLACNNGLIRSEDNFRKVHLGGRLEESQLIQWSEATQQKNLELIQAQIKDCVSKFISKEYLGQMIDKLSEKGEQKLDHPIAATTNACKFYGINDKDTEDILKYFVEGGDTTAFGLSQAITYYAHETSDPDMQYELEKVGYDIIEKIASFDKPDKK